MMIGIMAEEKPNPSWSRPGFARRYAARVAQPELGIRMFCKQESSGLLNKPLGRKLKIIVK